MIIETRYYKDEKALAKMNKRLVKKKIKKAERVHGVIAASGNKGGDILTIIDNCDGTVHLRSGHCCVMTIDKTVPVEFITATLSQIMLDHNNDINSVIDSFDWSDEFKTELKGLVVNGSRKAI